MSDKLLLDLNLLQDYKSNLGIELLNEMFLLYEEKSIIYLGELKLALSSQDNTLWYEKCHKMKGASGSMGFIQLTHYLKKIEHDTSSLEIKTDYYQKIMLLNSQIIIVFKDWLENNK